MKAIHLIPLTAVLIACNKDKENPLDPTPPANEEELITTLALHFQSSGGSENKYFEFQDLDGAGGADPVITAEPLSADTMYLVELELLNESVAPAEDITAEVQAEAEAHQFFFTPGTVNASVAYDDADSNGDPIGLATIWTLGAAGVDSVLVTLRHGLDKGAPGVSGGDITNAGGETDIEVRFPLAVQ